MLLEDQDRSRWDREAIEETDWRRIAALYSLLHHLWPSPVVALNRAVAVAMADGFVVPVCTERLDEYLNVARARALIKQTDRPDALAETAYAAGYCDQAYFIHDFTAVTGVTLGEYQRHVQWRESGLGVVSSVCRDALI